MADFKKVLALDPSNKLARSQLETTQKMIRKAEFERVSRVSKFTRLGNEFIHVGLKAIEMEEEKDSVTRCREIIAEGT